MEHENYFINKLEKGEKIKICFMMHNAYWDLLRAINNKYPNCQIDVFGGSTEYLTYRRDVAHDYDLILLVSNHFYNEYERENLRDMAILISNLQQKRVTTGYLSILFMRDKKEKIIFEYAKIMSFKNGEQSNQTIPLTREYLDAWNFLNLVSQVHGELEKSKVKQKI